MKKILLLAILILAAPPATADNEIWFVSDAEQTNLKATITRPNDGYVWDASLGTPAFAASADVDWVNRGIAVTEDINNPGVYYGDFPAELTAAGTYLIRIYIDAEVLEITDTVLKNFTMDWGGSEEIWNNTLDATVSGVSEDVWSTSSGSTVVQYTSIALPGLIGSVGTNVSAILTDTGTDGVKIADGAITTIKFGSNAIGETVVANDIYAHVADYVLNELIAGHTTEGSLADVISTILEDTGTTLPVSIAAVQTDLDTITDSGVDLKATGLDNIPITDPEGVANTFSEMVVQLWRRFFMKATATSSSIKTYADDNTTVNTTQTVTNDGVTQTVGAAE